MEGGGDIEGERKKWEKCDIRGRGEHAIKREEG